MQRWGTYTVSHVVTNIKHTGKCFFS